MEEIVIKDMSFQYDSKKIFDKINIEIKEGTFTTILGNNGSGKSTFMKILAGLLPHTGSIQIYNTALTPTNVKHVRKMMGFVLDSTSNTFIGETVLDDIIYILENMGESKKNIKKKIEQMDSLFGIGKYFEDSPTFLTNSKKALITLAAAVIHEPKILILDEAFVMMDEIDKKKAYSILVKLNKDKKMTILNITGDMNDALYGSDIIVFHKGEILLHGPTEDVLKEEKTFTKLDMNIPFIAELSNKLSYYKLTDHMRLDMLEVVNQIWK